MTKEQLFIQLSKKLSSHDLFYGHAVIDADDEAMMVLMYLFKQNVNEILSNSAGKVQTEDKNKAHNIVDERISSLKPMAYIIGEVHFCELTFIIDPRALVPRSPIAELIINGFKPWINMSNIRTALDLCTGSGCIGISVAKYFEHIQVDLSDISNQAIVLAKENIALHHVKNRVSAIGSDLFQNISKKYDLIIANPPYVSDIEYNQLPKEYKHEPKLGLVTEFNGLRIPLDILIMAPDFLNENGRLFLEVGYSDEVLNAAFPQIKFEWIDFLNGGEGVCVFSKQKLLEYQHYFKAFLERCYVI